MHGIRICNYLINHCISPLKLLSSNDAHGEVYSIQHYVIKAVSDLRQVGGFPRVLRFPPPYNRNIVKNGLKHHNHNLYHYWKKYMLIYNEICKTPFVLNLIASQYYTNHLKSSDRPTIQSFVCKGTI